MISATRTHGIIQNVSACEVPGFLSLAKAGNSGKAKNNLARDLGRKLSKRSKWPGLYYAKVHTWNTKKQVCSWSWVPILLPHEILYALGNHAVNPAALLVQEGLSQHGRRHLEKAATELGEDPSGFVPLGFWGDGVLFDYDR